MMRQPSRHVLLRQKRPLMTDKRAVTRRLARLFALGGILAGTILIYVWTRLEVVQLNYELLDLTREERRLSMRNGQLKVELAILMSPSRLSSMAQDRFKLKNPSRSQIIYIK